MTTSSIVALVVGLALTQSLQSQWPLFPADGTPRTPDGKADLKGPAPKTSDGKPDLSGVWTGADGPGGGPPGAPGGGRDASQVDAGIPRGGFQNLGIHMEGGLLPYQPAGLAIRTRRLDRNSMDHPDAHCLPLNPVQLWFHPQPRKLIQNAREIVFLAESNGGLRQIFTDGRPLPGTDVQPWWFGYSIGKWDGDTLVVESMGFRDDAWIDEQGSPLSNQGHVTERIRRPNYGTLEVQITVNDPKMYTKPFTVKTTQRLMADDELIEFVCGENNTVLPHLVPGK